MRSLFIFRRDLRLQDNVGLNVAAESGEVMLAFFFDPRQIEKNEFYSKNAIQIMIESLKELEKEVSKLGGKLQFFIGKPEELLASIIKEEKIDCVVLNRDCTPFSKRRDARIAHICKEVGVTFSSHDDLYLAPLGSVLTQIGEPYKVFTPFMRKVREQEIARPTTKKVTLVAHSAKQAKDIPVELLSKQKDLFRRGGRGEAISILENISRIKEYDTNRDYPGINGTSGLSAHLKFGTVSIREVWHSIGEQIGFDSKLLNELIWRDFYAHVAYHFPDVFGLEFQTKYRGMHWPGEIKHLEAWKKGMTGFPIVDAGMRQLVESGWMHNRVRMIVASFLTKDLLIDWREGEKFFAQHLIDYDPASNNGGWQWAASTGTDAQPYFRIFNPWSQQKRFDAEGKYIKKWVPELSGLTAKEVHGLEKGVPENIDYPPQIVDHKEMRKATLSLYAQ